MPTAFINPAFRRNPEEAAVIGHILASFGEIELMTCYNTALAHKLFESVMSTLYSIRVTSTRIEVALRLMTPAASTMGLLEEQKTVTPLIWHCLKIRNQYAHCNWADTFGSDDGLYFADLQNSANNPNFANDWKHVDIAVLGEQMEFFNCTMAMLNFIYGEIQALNQSQGPNLFPRPSIPSLAPLHNPPLEHVPQWLNANDKALHVAKAQAALGGLPTPTPAQQELDRQRFEKRARQKKQRRKSREGEQNAKPRSDPPET